MERDKEGDGLVHLRWEETKEGDTVHGARLTIETGAGFPISIMNTAPIATAHNGHITFCMGSSSKVAKGPETKQGLLHDSTETAARVMG